MTAPLRLPSKRPPLHPPPSPSSLPPRMYIYHSSDAHAVGQSPPAKLTFTMPSQKLSIQVREATVKDLNRIADISSLAFLNNALFDNLNPRRHEYFESFRYTRLRYARNAMLKPSMRLLVAETDGGDVVGYAIWERLGDDPIAQRVKAERDGIRLRMSSSSSLSSPTILGNKRMNE